MKKDISSSQEQTELNEAGRLNIRNGELARPPKLSIGPEKPDGLDFMVEDGFLSDEDCDILVRAVRESSDAMRKIPCGDPFWRGRLLFLPDMGMHKKAANIILDAALRQAESIRKFYGLAAPLWCDSVSLIYWPQGIFMGARAINANPDGSPNALPWRNFSSTCCLNDDYEGGDTYFTALDASVSPKKGRQLSSGGGLHHEKAMLKVLKGECFTLDAFYTTDERHKGWTVYKGKIPEDIDYKALSEIRITRPDSGLKVERFPSDRVQLYTIGHFMSDEECDALVEMMRPHMKPSMVTERGMVDYGVRSSSTCYLHKLENKFVGELEERIARTIGIPVAYSEGMQGQHYEVGQEFKPHMDPSERASDDFKMHTGAEGNRTWTFMIYLNAVQKGGGTAFPRLNMELHPQKGRAVIWNNLYPDGFLNYDTLHAGLPVLEGHKDIVTNWFRERIRNQLIKD